MIPARVLASSCIALVVPGCAAQPLRIDLQESTARPDRSAILFFVDGLDPTRMEAMIADGQLPQIERRFVQGGVGVDHAFASIPAITYANSTAIITGRHPGHHGILGNLWFDRRTLRAADYMRASTYRNVNDDITVPTLYDLLADHFTISVQNHTRRGVSATIDNPISSGLDWLVGDYRAADAGVADSLNDVVVLANRVHRWPSVLMLYFPGVDEIGHRYGPGSDEYGEALRNVDAQIGRVMDAIEQAKPAGASYFVLCSDHGMVPTHKDRTADIAAWLSDRCGLRVQHGPADQGDFAQRFDFFRRYDAVLIDDAHRRAVIHIPGVNGWHDTASTAAIQHVMTPPKKNDADVAGLHELPGVDIVCVRSGVDRVTLFTRRGVVAAERRTDWPNKRFRITPPPGGGRIDPLGYGEDETLRRFCEAGWHTAEDWLIASAGSKYPDLIPQIVQMFDSPRAGDIVIFAEDDWALGGEWKGGHGSCGPRDLRVPLFFAGPDLPAGQSIAAARVVDIMPTVIGLLGEQDRLAGNRNLDGVDRTDQLRNAGKKVAPSAEESSNVRNRKPKSPRRQTAPAANDSSADDNT